MQNIRAQVKALMNIEDDPKLGSFNCSVCSVVKHNCEDCIFTMFLEDQCIPKDRPIACGALARIVLDKGPLESIPKFNHNIEELKPYIDEILIPWALRLEQ